mmetsp:Transcript_25980/g.24836  ORF Transcript_25980/g.24836 Transcript_25980/m.24836 type:complete len:440 (-) Transcript_25980:26-1345(-)
MSANTELSSKQKRRINKRAAAKVDGSNKNVLGIFNEVVVSDLNKNADHDLKNETEKNCKVSTTSLTEECANIIRNHHSASTLNTDLVSTKKQSILGSILEPTVNTNKSHGKGGNGSSKWNFTVDYNDHFETPLVAYTDILPMLLTLAKALGKKPEDLVIYDPYYCQGGMVAMLKEMGFPKVINMNRDFYADVAMKSIPPYDILVTNPPYSGEHKPKLLKYLLNPTSNRSLNNKDKLSGSNTYMGKPFALLLPAYTATKSYWKEFATDLESKYELMNRNENNSTVGSSSHKSVLYMLPPESYEYRHPEGTGKDTPPFFSAWFLGGFTDTYNNPVDSSIMSANSSSSGSSSSSIITDRVRTALLRRPITTPRDTSFRVLISIDELVATGIITDKRPNPKNRKKLSKQRTVNVDSNIENKQIINKKKFFGSDDSGIKKKKRY